jgi:gas vesicle protein
MANKNRLVTAVVVGAAAGAVAGLMFAPKPGKVTRRFVSSHAGEARHKTAHYVTTLRQRILKVENPV